MITSTMKRISEQKNQRDLFIIMKFSTSLGLGVMCAFLYSLKDVAHDASLEFSAGTVVSFVVGAVLGWGFWSAVIRMMDKKAEELERQGRNVE